VLLTTSSIVSGSERDFHRGVVPLPGATIGHLTALAVVAREASLEAAARSIEAPVPVLSRRLAELEATAGAALVARTSGAVYLTPAGSRLLPHAEATLAHVEAARAELAGE
jgi:DNA-binding transcriptional LysR family regulator